jgi:hypothetical protein
MIRIVTTMVLVSALTPLGGRAVAQSGPLMGCYRADRPLGTAASATGWESTTPGLETFRLLDGGRVERPGVGRPPGLPLDVTEEALQRTWGRGSRWRAEGDTLYVTLSTRTSGWELKLVPAPDGPDTVYVGVARYLTDVVVADTAAWQPPRVMVRVERETCAPPG